MKKIFPLLILFLVATRAYADDGFYAEYGRADTTVISSPAQARLIRIGAMYQWDRTWFDSGNWHVTGFWDLGMAQWHGESPARNNQNVTDISITPVFRLTPRSESGTAPYVEAGILGIHLISPTYLYTNRQFSTAFQFGHILGFGLRLGAHQHFEIGFRYQHVSNANIKLPNNGMDFDIMHLAYWF